MAAGCRMTTVEFSRVKALETLPKALLPEQENALDNEPPDAVLESLMPEMVFNILALCLIQSVPMARIPSYSD